MKILFTGATGVIGRRAVPELVAAGHAVVGVARSDEGRAWLAGTGAEPIELDLFDRDAVDRRVAGVEAVVHYATAIPPLAAMAKPASWAMNDRLRTEATSHLVDAAIRHRAERFVQESISFTYADGGDGWLDEDAPVEPVAPVLRSALDAERQVARFANSGGEGVSLRFGRLYGPGRASAELVEAVAKRRMPVLGDGGNYVSSVHAHDAATATVAALTAPSGVYNVSDDEPVRSAELTESLAEALGAAPPRRVPVLLGRLAMRSMLPVLTVSHRVDAGRFRSATGWEPTFSSVRAGWAETVSAPAEAAS